MKRGFFSSNPQDKRTSITHGPSRNPSSTSIALSNNADNEVKHVDNEEPLIKSKHEYTVIEEENPLILLADHRIDDAPYFGYFPPNSAIPEMVIIDQDLKTIEDAASWTVWTASCDTTGVDPVFEIKGVEGKGMAMIACRDIAKGELIHKERPLYVSLQTYNVAPDQGHKTGDFCRSALNRLGPQQQEAVLSLSNCWGDLKDSIPGTLATNYLPVDMQPQANTCGRVYCGCFATLSRTNHSCVPNANYFFEFGDFTGRLYAVRDMKAGEEITIMYCDLLQPQKVRKEKLLQTHRFMCSCSLCILPPTSAESKKSNDNRLFIQQIIATLNSATAEQVGLAVLEKAILAADEEALVTYKAQLLYLGGAILLHGDKSQAMMALSWLQQAKDLYQILEGADSYHVAELQKCIGT